jgi:hypothetical protein
MAYWDLSDIIFGENSNISNPNLLLESGLREGQIQILNEVRWRYRQAASLVRRLQRPPADPASRLSLQLRLEEHAAYLEALAGRQIVTGETI